MRTPPCLPLVLLFVTRALQLHAAEPPTAPILRIEAGMHTAQIRRIATDSAGRLALTASEDKTARLWELSSGRLLRVLRPPIGDGKEGMLYSCALTPDGTLAAVGGYTQAGEKGLGNVNVYLFNTATGRMVRRLGGLSDAPFDLAFSARGDFLAAVGDGLRLWETRTGREVGRDTDYGGRNIEYPGSESYGVDWHGDRLVTTCTDGNLRLYQFAQDGLKLLAREPVKGGQQPYSARFSPDGQRIAVGFDDSANLTVLDGTDLRFLYAPDITGVDNGTFYGIAWARDGAALAAGGRWHTQNSGVWTQNIRVWSQAGRGQSHDYPIASNTIMDLRPLPDGGILFAASEPAWGVLTADGKRILLGASPGADYRDDARLSHFRVSADGTEVGFGYEGYGKVPARFSVAKSQLTLRADPVASDGDGLRAPWLDGLKVSDWKNNSAPKLDGQPLPLGMNETSRSLAVARDASGFLLGSDNLLSSFTATGATRWFVETPGVAWAVNLDNRGRLAVAGYGDHTIRWHQTDAGRELLAFFPHADRRRWVAWATEFRSVATGQPFWGASTVDEPGTKTSIFRLVQLGAPTAAAGIKDGDRLLGYRDAKSEANIMKPGAHVRMVIERNGRKINVEVVVGTEHADQVDAVYYDCSPGAEDLIGWQVNRGKDHAADFFSINQFRNVYYRPDAIHKVLTTQDVSSALRDANRESKLSATKPEAIAEVIARLSPPVVELETGGVFGVVRLPAGATEVKVRYSVRKTGREAPTKVVMRFNGRLVDFLAPLPPEGETAEASVPVPAATAGELTIFAEHRLAVSEPAVLRIERTVASAPSHRRTLYLVSAGVAHFESNKSLAAGGSILKEGDIVLDDIPNSDRDAEHTAATLQAQKGRFYDDVRVTTLTNDKATAPAVRAALRKVATEAKPEDIAIVFFSSHGVVDPKLGFYIATSETDPMNPAATALTGQELSTLLEGIKARTVLALDTCHAGGAFGGARLNKVVTSPNDLTGFINGLSSADQGTVVLSSSAAAEQSLDDPEKGGIFTQAFCEALTNKAAANADGLVTCGTMQVWLDKRVPELVAALVKGDPNAPQQTPVCVIPKGVPDFPLAKP